MRISAAAAKWPLVLVGVVGISSCFTSAAVAGMLATTNLALNDGLGPDAGRWRGSAAIDVDPVPVFGDEIEAVVDWAAFAPGKFQLYLNANHPGAVDPSAPGEVVYAYEVFSVAAASPGISVLTVGVDAADARGTISAPTSVALTGGEVPSGGGDQGTSMAWNFSSITAGEKSRILVFSSIFAPQLDQLMVMSGLASEIPSPLVASISDRLFTNEIPEPASLVLLAFGAGVMLAGRRFRA